MPFCSSRYDLELGTDEIFFHVDIVAHALNINFITSVGPRAEFQLTELVVEWEIGDVDVASTANDGWCEPFVLSVVIQDDFGLEFVHCSRCVTLLGAANSNTNACEIHSSSLLPYDLLSTWLIMTYLVPDLL